VKNNLNPDFSTSFTIEYYFEKNQDLKFLMIDGDGHGDYDTIGEVVTTLGKIMGSKAQTFQNTIMHQGRKSGELIVRAEGVQESNQAISMSQSWRNVNNYVSGCMGLCKEETRYSVVLLRQVPN